MASSLLSGSGSSEGGAWRWLGTSSGNSGGWGDVSFQPEPCVSPSLSNPACKYNSTGNEVYRDRMKFTWSCRAISK